MIIASQKEVNDMITAIQNFQIPVTNFDRALKFYEALMGYDLQIMETANFKLGVFQFDPEKGAGGCIIQSDGLAPSQKGTLVYLHTGQNLQPYIDRVKEAGGNVFIDKTPLGPGMGYYGIIDDTEGNRVGLYSDE